MLSTLKGFRDFLPVEKRTRDFIASKIRHAFELYGFEPLETPTLEYASLLLGKYGREADKLVYSFKDRGEREVALRYDQTVPTARVLAQYQNQLPRCFRRYQMQNVFRADKPQKGRFREFMQCDIDVFGSTDMIADAEVLACTYAAYRAIGFSAVRLQVNDRVVLINTLTPFVTPTCNVFSIVQTIDKLDKIGEDGVVSELVLKGFELSQARLCLDKIRQVLMSSHLAEIVRHTHELGVPREAVVFIPTLARGLDYYTGMIFEVYIEGYRAGAVGGGGRYDNLIKQLGGVDIPAVGMACGFDRTVEAAHELGVVSTTSSNTRVLMTVFDDTARAYTLELARILRSNNIAVEVFPGSGHLDRQLKLADSKSIPFAIIAGSKEIEQRTCTVKDLKTRTQETVSVEKLVDFINNSF